MGRQLKYDGFMHKSRLELARDAIWMFYNKLQPEDIFSLITFNNYAQTIIPSQFVRNLNANYVKNKIYSSFESGGTTIKEGFNEAMKNLQSGIHKYGLVNYDHRIIMLTDVADNSVGNEKDLIAKISSSEFIHTTIVGISDEFQSDTC